VHEEPSDESTTTIKETIPIATKVEAMKSENGTDD